MNFHSSGQPNPEPEKNSKPIEQATGEQQADAKLRKGGVFESPVNEAVEVKSSNTFAAGNYQPDLAAEVYSKTPLRNTPLPENRRESAGTASTTDTGAAKPDGRSTASAMVDTKRDTGVKQQTEVSLPTSAIPAKDGARAVVLAQGESQTQFTRGGPQGADVVPSGIVKPTDTRTVPSEVKTNPSEVKSAPTENRPNSMEVKSIPTESRVNPVVTDGGSGTRPATAQAIETPPQSKAAGTTQGDRVTTSDNAGGHRVEPSTAAVGAAYMPPGRKDEVVPSTTTNRPAVAESATANVATNTVRAELKPDSKSTTEDSTATAGSQFRPESKVEPTSALPTSAQQKFDTQRAEPLATAQGKFEPARGSDVISTQGSTNPTAKVEGSRIAEPRLDAGKPVDQPGSKDTATFRDPKAAGVANEVLGQKTDAGPRSETSTSAGIKSDSSGQKADQMVRGIEGRINEGPKQPSGADVRVPGSTETSTAGRQPGTTDGATSGSRQPGSDVGGKSHSITDGDKPPSGAGGSSAAADSTKKFDSGMQQGGRSEGQSGNSGMGGGSSAPIDRAPHAPFRVEDGQQSGAKGEGGLRGDLGAKGEVAAGGKGEAAIGGKGESAVGGGKVAGDGTRFDTAEVRGNQPGTRFDSGEVRGTQPGTRFDAGEVKDSRGGIPTGGKSGGSDTAGVSDSSIVKGTDVSGTKAATGGQGIGGSGGSGGSGSSDGGILGDKRQPQMLPDGLINQGGKPGKAGDGIGIGHSGDDSVPFILPGALGGRDGGRRPSDQIFGDKGKGGEGAQGKADGFSGKPEPGVLPAKAELGTVGGKPESSSVGGKADSGSIISKFDGMVSGKGDSNMTGTKGESSAELKDKGHKADAGVSAAMSGQVGTGAAEVGSVLKNFAQSVLADGKSGQTGDSKAGQGGDKAVSGSDKPVQAGDNSVPGGDRGARSGDKIVQPGDKVALGGDKDAKPGAKPLTGSEGVGKETPGVRQDFAGPGQKTRILDQSVASSDTRLVGSSGPADKGSGAIPGSTPIAGEKGGDKVGDLVAATHVIGTGGTPIDGSKKKALSGVGSGDADRLGDDGGEEEARTSIDESNLPEVDLQIESDESEKVEEIGEVEESAEAKLEDEMHYELALGLQLYTSIAEAPYGAYHYFTKEGDTVEGVSREIVGDARTAPLVFSLNKEHILASTEYGVHPFKVGVMVQLPTPRDLKNFFGSQT